MRPRQICKCTEFIYHVKFAKEIDKICLEFPQKRYINHAAILKNENMVWSNKTFKLLLNIKESKIISAFRLLVTAFKIFMNKIQKNPIIRLGFIAGSTLILSNKIEKKFEIQKFNKKNIKKINVVLLNSVHFNSKYCIIRPYQLK